jgi:integrase
MINPYKVTTVMCTNGERLPLLTFAATSLPVRLANSWLLLSRRIRNQASTLEREARTIGYLHWWADINKIDLGMRFESGDALTANEINPSLYDWLRRDFTRSKVIKMVVASSTFRSRLETIRDYILWHMDQALSITLIRGESFEYIATRRGLLIRQFNKDMPSVRINRRIGLEPRLREKLLQIIHPGYKGNPWDESVKYRNYLLCLVYIMLGLRRSEALKLYLNDLNLNGTRTTITVQRKPDDINDLRKNEPRVKTLGRIIPITAELARIINTYIMEYRIHIPNAKKSPFLFLSSRTGKPLSLLAVNNIFYQIIKHYPEFDGILSPHILRHTYNDLLSDVADSNNVSEHDASEVRNYLCGWSRFSQQGNNYRQRHIQQKATELSLLHQQNLFKDCGLK